MFPHTLNIIFEGVENFLEPLELTHSRVRKSRKIHFFVALIISKNFFQVSKNKPSNLYSGTEMLGALEGLEFLLNQQEETTKRAHRSTTVVMFTDGRPERRSWWDTRVSPVSDSVVGTSISLPDSLGGEEITTS